MTRSRLVRLFFVTGALLVLARAQAAPLDADTCAKLGSEHGQLEAAGVEQTMAKGPVWGKANLAPDKLNQVRRYIELEEQLLFRCTGRALVKLPAEADPDPAAATLDTNEDAKEGAPGADSAKAADPPATKKKADTTKKAPVPAAKSPGGPAKPDDSAKKKAPAPAKGEAPAKQAKQEGAQGPKAKVAPKAKAEDAYKAPPPDPAVNPFAYQLPPPGKQ